MTRRLKIPVAALTGLLLVVVCFAFLKPSAIRRSRQVQLGMRIAEVKAIMGPDAIVNHTTSKDGTITGSTMLARHNDPLIKLQQLASDLGAGFLTGGSRTVMIVFNIDGRVKTIYRGDEPVVQAP